MSITLILFILCILHFVLDDHPVLLERISIFICIFKTAKMSFVLIIYNIYFVSDKKYFFVLHYFLVPYTSMSMVKEMYLCIIVTKTKSLTFFL